MSPPFARAGAHVRLHACLRIVLLTFAVACGGGSSQDPLFGSGGPVDDAGAGGEAGAAADARPDGEPAGDGAADASDGGDATDAATGCKVDVDCAGSAFGPVCDVPSGKCGHCSPTADKCGTGLVCRATDLQCEPGCKTTADCQAGGGQLTCDPVTHQCIGCTTDVDCPLGTLCDTAVRQCKQGCSAAHGCPSSQSCCNGACADTSTDTSNCGVCGNACGAADHAQIACSKGACVIGSCTGTWSDCNGNLKDGCEKDLAFDPQNCGACFSPCSANHAAAACVNSQCADTCQTGWADCNGDARKDGCETPVSDDPANCGGCGVACSTNHLKGVACTGGACTGTCANGWSDCNGNKQTDGCESSTSADPQNCGGCGVTCSANNVPQPSCGGGVCNGACATGFADCNGNLAKDGCETPVDANPQSCGGCGLACSTTGVVSATCAGGTCNGACVAGYADCNGDKQVDGCETPITNNPASCGACGVICSTQHVPAPTCTTGTCDGACAAGYTDCNGNKQTDGCEIATGTDPNNCGGCGAACSSNHVAALACAAGTCTSACAAGYTDCDGDKRTNGCETYTSGDADNCGACGTKCSGNHVTTRTCSAGRCAGTCAAGYADCNGNLQADGCETYVGGNDTSNCGGCGVVCSSNNVTAACSAGSCSAGTCAAGFADCDGNKQTNGCETNITTSLTSCGACGAVCSGANGSASCTNGTCSLSCNSGYTDCNNNKADGCEAATATDVNNCGGCGVKCSSNNVTAVCSGGSCSAGACKSGFADCNGNKQTDGCETPTTADVNNCGGCGVKCSTKNISASCSVGSCNAGTCLTGFADCNGNKQTDGCETPVSADVNNCGGCGVKCSTSNVTAACAGGSCSAGTCAAGFADCNGNKQTDGCEVNTSTSPDNCGGCGTVCSATGVATRSCTGGACTSTCATGYTDCNNNKADGCEANTSTDPDNCGGCGIKCSANGMGTRTCTNGVCSGTCASGYSDCDNNKQTNGCEVATGTDANNCGACGRACSTNNVVSATCASGVCTSACSTGYADCDGNKQTNGCEINITSNTSACGGCGKTCYTGANITGVACSSGTCTGTCAAGYADCDGNKQTNGCETSTATDANNCGACGTVCSSSNVSARSCAGSVCTSTCSTGFGDCDGNKQTNGCETNIYADPNNCGACASACSSNNVATLSCTTGVCTGTCASGWSDCNGNKKTDGCETQTSSDLSNCGACGTKCSTTNVVNGACSAGTCTGACASGTNNCDNNLQSNGCEVTPASDPNNCGGCSIVCSSSGMATRTCTGSTCDGTCATNYLDCDSNKLSNGCEVNKLTDKNNCGNCGNVCSGATPNCVNGTCTATPACNKNVLVIGAVYSSSALSAKLTALGLTPTVLTTVPSAYSGTPAATGFGAIFIDEGSDYSVDMPTSGQASILAAINAGSGIGFNDWISYTYPNYSTYYTSLRPYILFSYSSSWSSSSTSPATWSLTNAAYASTIWSGLSTSFSSGASVAGATGSVINGGTQIASVTGSATGPGVVIKDGATGTARVAFIDHAGEAYNTWYTDTNLVTLHANTIKWLARCQ